MICRDLPAWGAYFWAYEVLKDLFKVNSPEAYSAYPMMATLMLLNAGGFSGIVSWLVSYPFDVVKTKI